MASTIASMTGRLFFVKRCMHLVPRLPSIQVKMPSLSPTMTQGTIVQWLKKEGQECSAGDVLCEIQTDKAVVAMEMDDEGILAKILKDSNTPDLEVGTVIAILAEEGEDWKKVATEFSKTQESSVSKKQQTSYVEADQKSVSTQKSAISDGPLGPAVKIMLHEYNLKAEDITPSGPHGMLLKGDVIKYVEDKKLKKQEIKPKAKIEPELIEKPAQPSEALFTDVQLSGMRKTIAKRLTESKQAIPHAYCTTYIRVDNTLKFRKALKNVGISVTVNDFIVKACAQALIAVPKVNICVRSSDGSAEPQKGANISVAVATPSGLITPIIFEADRLGLVEIAQKVRELADKAKNNKLQLHEFQGGSFTISNLGMYGILEFTAIINPPQAAILAVGGARPELQSDMSTYNNMAVTLCYDGRVIESDAAVEFLEYVKTFLERPEMMIVGGFRSDQHATVF